MVVAYLPLMIKILSSRLWLDQTLPCFSPDWICDEVSTAVCDAGRRWPGLLEGAKSSGSCSAFTIYFDGSSWLSQHQKKSGKTMKGREK